MKFLLTIILILVTYYHVLAQSIKVEGKVLNSKKEALEFVSIGILGQTLGTLTNHNGVFVLNIPTELLSSRLHISHMGYKTYTTEPIEVLIANKKQLQIFLEEVVTELNEVIVSKKDYSLLVKKAIDSVFYNYELSPVILEGFYRERLMLLPKGTLSDYPLINEGRIEVYKTPYITQNPKDDHVKILRCRTNNMATLVSIYTPKVSNGPNSGAITADVVKSDVGFLNETDYRRYNFYYENTIQFDSLSLLVLSFDRRSPKKYRNYKGKLYIDEKTSAIVKVEYELDANGLKDFSDKNYTFNTYKIVVNYKQHNRRWYLQNSSFILNCTRFDNNNYELEVKYITTNIKKGEIQPFPKEDRFEGIFSDYAEENKSDSFWEGYNILEDK